MAEVARVAGPRARHVHVRVLGGGTPESYTIRGHGDEVTITAADANGAMYGALEFAERAKLRGSAAWHEAVTGKPYLRDRGMNLFLNLPWDYAKNDTDYDPAALTDPNRWWFQNDDYWNTLFDLMARARLNWLDIHGMWNISVTDAPNLYAYFIQSDKYPQVGVDPAIKAANLRQLNRVIAMAHARGIRVSLMAYQATLNIPQNPKPPYPNSETVLYDYTREMVEKMIRQAPALDAIGFRIGESGKGEAFFNCYIEAVKRSGRKIPLITRSWITHKKNVLPLARAFDDFTVEIKYNGEQWGPDYPVVGGRMANWYSYSFEDYLSDSGSGDGGNGAPPAAKMWPGNPTPDGSRWPDEPYKIVWQVRACGTHRIFPFYEPDRVRNSIKMMKIGSASGYTVEGVNAYYPASPQYYLANPDDQYCAWVHQRDELYWLLWGRMGYDPQTPESVFQARLDDWFGSEGSKVAALWKAASQIVPLAYSGFSLGPDHRNHAPELEWGGTTEDLIAAEPFDSLTFIGVRESLADKAIGANDGRIGFETLAETLSTLNQTVRTGVASIDVRRVSVAQQKRLKELLTAAKLLAYLGDYYQGRFRSATDLAAMEGNMSHMAAFAGGDLGFDSHCALEGWTGLSTSPDASYYRPFTEHLRMGTNSYHWRSALPSVKTEADRMFRRGKPLGADFGMSVNYSAPDLGRLSWRSQGDFVDCSIPSVSRSGKGLRTQVAIDHAWLLIKPLPSSTFFHRVPMRREHGRFLARFRRENWGHCIAAEVVCDKETYRIPSVLRGETPYLIVPARKGPTPQIYNAQEAMNYLNPAVLTPQKHGLLLLCSRAWSFHRGFPLSVRRKLLDPVSRGMTLLVLQEDYLSGRYPLDWLPKPLQVVAGPNDYFDPKGALGLPIVHAPGVLFQRFVAGGDWEVFGNGGIAHLKYGQGEIWMVQARLQQNLEIPSATQALARLLHLGGTTRPVVLIDSGTESAALTSAVVPDLMNALGVPFLTLGEVIAKEQGMNSTEPIAGQVADDDVLEGHGRDRQKAYLAAKVKAAATAPTPPTRAAFEPIRAARRAELMRALGLAPMPPRTPLNARITATTQHRGYRIEKIVLESRPGFYVTALAYVPDGPAGAHFPVIMNPIGHWPHKKAEPTVQARCIFEALHGYLCLVVDSPGFSFEGDNKIERRPEGSHMDLKLVQGGTNTTGTYVWDLIRALDYVATRPDADMGHVGITGASGGGLATLYAFAADDRYRCAVPVVYMSSMELAPDNGCFCNHVPGTLQVGDRSDVIAIEAPKPVLIIGAQEDGEFPPDAMRLTGEKMQRTWALFDAAHDVQTLIFPGGHDYNRAMREAALGFFDRHLKGVGDGSPTPEPTFSTADPNSPELFVLETPMHPERTLRDLALEGLQHTTPAPFAEVVRVNGGLPQKTPLHYHEIEGGAKRHVTFESEPGLTIPGVLTVPQGEVKGVRIVVADVGKAAALADPHAAKAVPPGYACLTLDVRGCGELAGIDLRYLTYLGTALPFAQAWDIVRAAEAMRRYSAHIDVVGRGPGSSLAALYAALIDPTIARVVGYDALREWADVFRDDMPDLAIQPRANLCGPLSHLRSLAPHSEWHFRGE
jgi:cephalosporin-C deacetylase-like acetyl esterase